MARIHALQLGCLWHDANQNRAAARSLIAAQTVAPGSLLVLPEMFDVGFTMNAEIACATADETKNFLAEIARSTQSLVVAGHATRDESGRAANQASIIDANGISIASYTKNYGFTPAGEHLAYARGEGPTLFEWAGFKVAPTICYDLRFPELYRAAARRGAELFLVIANWPDVRIDHWITLARARAIENQAYVVAVNRVGRDPSCTYPGRSMVIDPKGAVIAEAGAAIEVLSAELDVNAVRNWRRDFPALSDTR